MKFVAGVKILLVALSISLLCDTATEGASLRQSTLSASYLKNLQPRYLGVSSNLRNLLLTIITRSYNLLIIQDWYFYMWENIVSQYTYVKRCFLERLTLIRRSQTISYLHLSSFIFSKHIVRHFFPYCYLIFIFWRLTFYGSK